MKGTFVLFAFFTFCIVFAKTDSTYVSTKHEVSFVANSISLIDIGLSLGRHDDESNTSSAYESHYPINLQGRYMYNINRHIAIGALVGFDNCDDMPYCIYTNMAFRAYWFNKKHIGMYSLIGVGPAFIWGDKSKGVALSPNIIPVGVEYGGVRLRGFLELGGAGNVGIFAGGVKYSF